MSSREESRRHHLRPRFDLLVLAPVRSPLHTDPCGNLHSGLAEVGCARYGERELMSQFLWLSAGIWFREVSSRNRIGIQFEEINSRVSQKEICSSGDGDLSFLQIFFIFFSWLNALFQYFTVFFEDRVKSTLERFVSSKQLFSKPLKNMFMRGKWSIWCTMLSDL